MVITAAQGGEVFHGWGNIKVGGEWARTNKAERFQIGGKNKRLKELDRSTVLSMLCIFLFFNELHALI